MTEELVFRIDTDKDGNRVSLDRMSVEVVEVLQSFISSLSALAKLQPDPSQVSICIRQGSAETAIACANAPQLLATTNREERKVLGAIHSTICLNGLGYSVFVLDGRSPERKNVTESFKKQRFILTRNKKTDWVEEVLFLTGEFDVPGGKTTNFHLHVGDETFVVGCSKAQVRRYRTYDEVRISALKRFKEGQRPIYTLIDFYVTKASYDDYSFMYKKTKNDNSLKRYDLLHDYIVDRYNHKDYVRISKLMKLYAHEYADPGLVRTILMTLKPVIRPNLPSNNGTDKMKSVVRLFSTLFENLNKSTSPKGKK